jgi:hypothetical protein
VKGEIRAGPFIPTVKITEYFTLLSQLSLPPPVAAPRRWKRRWRDEADLLHGSLSHTLTRERDPPVLEKPTVRHPHIQTHTHTYTRTRISLALSLSALASLLSFYARLQIYAPRLAALISESSRPAPSVMKEINLLF